MLTRVISAKDTPLNYRGVQYALGDIIDFVDDADLLGRMVAAGQVTVSNQQRVTDDVKIDVGMVPISLASTNLTGKYYSMANADRAVFVCQYGPLVTTGTVKLEVFQASDVIGTSAALVVGASAITNATEITHVAAVKQITLSTFLATVTITITAYKKNSSTVAPGYPLVYTAHATTTTIASRQFSIAGTDTQDAVELLSCLNDPTYGTPGIYWTSSAGVVIGQAVDDMTTFTITCSADNASDVRTEPQGQLIVEVDTLRAPLGWVAAKVTTTATVLCAVMLIRHGSKFSPNAQQTDILTVSV